MRILFLTFYYEPDLSAGSFRSSSLVEELKKDQDIKIDIITTHPNRYPSFSVEAQDYESNNNISINRIRVPSHRNGLIDQVLAFIFYYFKSIKIAKKQHYDLVFATSSRLFTAFLASKIARKKKSPLYIDVRDIFLDTIDELLPFYLGKIPKIFIAFIERYTFKKAKIINLVSDGFTPYFKKKYPASVLTNYTNGIDKIFLKTIEKRKTQASSKRINILYAGNLGEGQGLHHIIPELAYNLSDKIDLTIIGDGGKKDTLIASINEHKNVEILLPVDRFKLVEKYANADILFLHLNKFSAFEKVLPSKIFEYAATGKPILAGVSGYAAKFLQEEVENAEIFSPGDVEGAIAAYDKLKLVDTDRSNFIDKYSRQKISKLMALDIVNSVDGY